MVVQATRIIVCVSAAHMVAGLWRGKKLLSHTRYPNSEPGYQAFASFITQFPEIDVSMIVDSFEETYQTEYLPHVTGGARQEMLERKLNQFNRNAVLRVAQHLGRAADKRKDDFYLLMALNNMEMLAPWLQVIEASNTPLKGIYLLPMLSQVLAKQLKLSAKNMLFCEALSSGLRQTYMADGQVRMSRLVPMDDVKPAQLAYFYLVEMDKTRLYLLSQRFLLAEDKLQLVIPAWDESAQAIGNAISQEQEIECLTPKISAEKLQLSQIAEFKRIPELLHMQLLANGNVPISLAPSSYTRGFQLSNLRRWLYGLAAAILCLGLLFSIVRVWQIYQLNQQVQQLAQQTQQQQAQYARAAQAFPDIPISSQSLKAAIDLHRAIKANAKTPKRAMQIVANTLSEFNEVNIQRIRWLQTPDLEAKDDNPAAVTDVLANTAQNNLFEIAFVNARIEPFSGDYRHALSVVKTMTSQLKSQPQVMRVEILQEPVNTSSLVDLRGSTSDDNAASRPQADFKLKIVLNPEKTN